MKLKLHQADIEEIILEHASAAGYQHFSPHLKENHLELDHFLGRGSYKEISFDGIHIAYGDLRFRESTILQFDSGMETVEMHFDLFGETSTEIVGHGTSGYEFSQHTHNIIYVPGIKGKIDISPGMRMLEIKLNPTDFEKYLVDSDLHQDFLNDIRMQNPCSLAKHNMPITQDMLQLLYQVIECSHTGIYKRLYLEARVINLLLLQLEQFAAHECKIFCSLKPADIEKMHHARELIIDRLHSPCSLIDLARQLGTNEFTLKKGFKEVFGTTVFGMVADLKLKQAKEMLLSGNRNIAEVSYDAGYKNPTHFSAAFKRKFGITPTEYMIKYQA